MTRVLAYHEKRRAEQAELGNQAERPSSRRRGPDLSTPVAGTRASKTDTLVNHVATEDGARRSQSQAAHSDHEQVDYSEGKAEMETTSQSCLKVRQRQDMHDMPHRRSRRQTLGNQHEAKDAQLVFDLVHIRKKLNFKESATNHDTRPRKRVKREAIRCHCHVTIWNNKEGLSQTEPLVRKTHLCDVSSFTLENGHILVDVDIEKPFVFHSRELQVPVLIKNETVYRLSDKYFLEIKIIPIGEGDSWPPIPLLGASDGDQANGLGSLAAETLQGSLIARYTHLPQAPDRDIPLSVYYLHQGRTYRSKFGFEVNSYWEKRDGTAPVKGEATEPELASWMLDDKQQPFGRQKASTPKAHRSEAVVTPQQDVRITFNVDAKGSSDTPREFRRAHWIGFKCPVCATLKFNSLEALRFHFHTSHSKYDFDVEKEDRDPVTSEISAVTFKVKAKKFTRPRLTERDQEGAHINHEVHWAAPESPFDLPAFVKGDQSWVSEKKKPGSSSANLRVSDPLQIQRQRDGGFLHAEHVPAFRPPQRRKQPNIRLHTLSAEKNIPYTSFSYRQLLEDEEAHSESDDEIDDNWLVQKTLESLEVIADRHKWSDEERMLRSKWNQARMMEKLSHPRYLSDCLVRFVKSERTWLANGNQKLQMAWLKFLDELLKKRVINDDVVRDLWCLMYEPDALGHGLDPKQDPRDVKENTGTGSTAQHQQQISPLRDRGLSRAEKARALMSLSDSDCGFCRKAILDMELRGVRCSEFDCEAPNVSFHTRCARCKIGDKLSWKCPLCLERMVEESTADKEKNVDHVKLYQ